jgi:hypothetical protein
MRAPRIAVRTYTFHSAWLLLLSFSEIWMPKKRLDAAALELDDMVVI